MSEGLSGAGFDLDLLHGKAREDAFAHILTRATFEVKSDAKARNTGNIFVEFRQHGRPSGIATTKADWWVIEVNDDVWLVLPTERLKDAARLAWKQKRCARGGDFDAYEGALVPIHWLTQSLKAA